MGGISFFKVPQHRVFNYQPLYYDPEKERREQRKKELGLDDEEAEADGASYTTGSLIRSGGMRMRHTQFTQKMESQKKKSQAILIALIIGLSVVAYYMVRDYWDEFYNVIFN